MNNRFLIITGMSGSGKTSASRAFADFGYYCVDNLPAKLIPEFVNIWIHREVEIEKVALIVDIRERDFVAKFPKVWKAIKEKISPRLIYMEASDDTLIKRYSASRRPHPLSKKKSVREGIDLERKRLEKIRNMADDIIDTSGVNIGDFKRLLAKKYLSKASLKMQVEIMSFGYKYGIPLDSDLVFDTRFLPNPYYIDNLRNKTGKHKIVQEYVLNAPETKKFMEELFHFIDYLMPKFEAEGKSYLTISIGCTGGKHRSVTLAEKTRDFLKTRNLNLTVSHRDIFK